MQPSLHQRLRRKHLAKPKLPLTTHHTGGHCNNDPPPPPGLHTAHHCSLPPPKEFAQAPEDQEAGNPKHDEGESGPQGQDRQGAECACKDKANQGGALPTSHPQEGTLKGTGRQLGVTKGGLSPKLSQGEGSPVSPPAFFGQQAHRHPLLSQEGSSMSKQGGLSRGGCPFTQRMGPSHFSCFSDPT